MINGPSFIISLPSNFPRVCACFLKISVREIPWGEGCRQSTLVCFKRDCILEHSGAIP